MSSWIRRLLAVAFWLGVGALAAGIVGLVIEKQGAALPFIFGIIAVTVLGPLGLIVGVRKATLRYRPESAPAADLPRFRRWSAGIVAFSTTILTLPFLSGGLAIEPTSIAATRSVG